MASTTHRVTRHRLTILSASVALIGGGVVAANLAGAASGISALDYAQCQNGGAGTPISTSCPTGAWINGILNSANSQYSEDDVTPQRLTVQFPDKGTSREHTITLRYLDRKAGSHAYDYLAAANTTQTTALDDRCNGIPSSYCPSGTGAGGAPSQASVVPAYQDDTTAVPSDPGQGTGLAVDHMANLSADDLKLSLYGATFDSGAQATVVNATPAAGHPAISTPTHDNACLGCGDDYARVVLSFQTPSTAGPHNVQLLFGGHLAAGFNQDGWGEHLGAGSISGGPYHIKWDAADGVSVGNRDNQIMSSAIAEIQPVGVTIITDPTPATATVGDTSTLTSATDDVEIQPSDSTHPPSGTVTFDLYGPYAAQADIDCAGTALSEETGVALTATSPYTATSSGVDLTSAAPGIYQWVAHYVAGSDAYNSDTDGACPDTSEQVVINPATPGGTSSQTINDTVTLTGGVSPTGNVDFFAYASLADCQADEGNATGTGDVFSSTNAVSSDEATSDDYTPVPADGTDFWWRVYYEGDTNNAAGDVEVCTQTFSIDNG